MDPTKNTTQKTKEISNTDPIKNTTQKTKEIRNTDPIMLLISSFLCCGFGGVRVTYL
jgi:hypothetical protein